MRTAQLAHQTPHRLARRRGLEVELTGLGRPLVVAGFDLSISGRFSDVHRGLRTSAGWADDPSACGLPHNACELKLLLDIHVGPTDRSFYHSVNRYSMGLLGQMEDFVEVWRT